jgi:hypothetical protein
MPMSEPQGVVVLLVGGGGYLNLDDAGCPRALKGNFLVRTRDRFQAAGFATALVDSPSDYTGDDGLEGFRSDPKHAEDIGKVIADVRTRAKGPLWLVGTSRGTISAVNVASRASGAGAPDGLVLSSALMFGSEGMRKAWVAQSVFDLPLESITMPILVVGHADDRCLRSPPSRMEDITARTKGVREQVVVVTGGPGRPAPGVDACEGKAPHGYLEQEAEVVAGIVRFINDGKY